VQASNVHQFGNLRIKSPVNYERMFEDKMEEAVDIITDISATSIFSNKSKLSQTVLSFTMLKAYL
jgi:hypothetical protein